MNTIHQEMAKGRWNNLSFIEQMANIGSEVERSIKWKNKRKKYAENAFERFLELIDLTVADRKNKKRLKEILRVREMFSDFFIGDNIYNANSSEWQKYFFYFNFAARLKQE